MNKKTCLIIWGVLLITSVQLWGQDKNFHIYLCFGQSNMEGNAAIEAQDRQLREERFLVMETVDCPDLQRKKGYWYKAVPPLTRCNTGLSPADYFGRTLVQNLPDSIRVGVINVSVGGCKIELFDKDKCESYIATAPDWMINMINEYDGNPYKRLVDMARLAQKDGVIRGILLHQGESDTGDTRWPRKVKTIYNNLLNDLNLDAGKVPLLAGELVNADQNGTCAVMNTIIATLPQTIPNSYVVSSSGCEAAKDSLHFSAAGYRELGKRYAAQMLSLLKNRQTLPYRNPALTSEERAKDLLSNLTLEEKVKLMGDNSDAVPRLGVKKFAWWSEALHGVANQGDVTVFPEPIGMAASFNDELVYQVFDAISDEARARFHDRERKGDERAKDNGLSVWTPNVNIFRDPRWGRGQETYGEDPYLTSRMGVAVVKGLQGDPSSKYRKLLACAKHYAIHSGPEWNRHILNLNNLDNRYLWETYLPAFQALVQKADVSQVMCAYHRQDDEPCCGNTRLLQRILRDEWGFKRVIVSDCGAIADFYTSHKVSSDALHAAVKAVFAGTDVECGYGYTYHELVEAVSRGLIYESDIDKSVLRLLVERFELGDFDDNSIVPWANIPASIINNEKHRQLALQTAHQSMTLLQNRNNILPLSKNQRIAVIGPNADDARLMWGNYHGTPVKTITALEGIRSVAHKDVFYDKGCDLVDDMIVESLLKECTFEGKPGIKANYWNNKEQAGTPVASVQYDKPIRLSTTGQHAFGPGVELQGFSGIYETEFTPSESGEIVFRLQSIGDCHLLVNEETVSEYSSWRFVTKRIPYSVEKGKLYNIRIHFTQNYDFANANFNFNIGKETPVDYNQLISKLKGIDVVVFVGGISGELEGEEMPIELPGFKGGDRTDIELPASQRNCIKALKEAGKKIILVNCSGSAIALVPEASNCEAIVQAWYAGESGGQAIADVLFGNYNPSGKLPVTFYKNTDQLPDFEDYDMNGRTYRYMTQEPLFPFGHGLSYTTFNIGGASVNTTEIKTGDTLELTVPIKNTGRLEGTEIIQVYVKKRGNEGPVKTLRSFKRVKLAPKEKVDIVFKLDPSFFEWYDDSIHNMSVSPGDFEIYYGTSSDKKDLQRIDIKLL